MNLNDNPEKLKEEEQGILNKVISRMNQVIESLDHRMQGYVAEARNADITINPDLYLAKILAQQGMKNTVENRKKILQARDELYHTRLLLQYEDSSSEGVEEIRVGLHSCIHGTEQFVTSWTMPLCRHYILDNASIDFESIVKDKYGEEYHTNYKLLVKNQVTLRFTRVEKAMNTYPGIFDTEKLQLIKETGFLSDAYLDEMIDKFNPDDYNPGAAAQIISDEFLQELLERRSTSEFKNIVFSIQKKQGEIIQAPYGKNMIVQGCAGSGKSMIMLHRLPIILYDNPNSLSRTNLYIITPSQMYIQLAENMRHQLEISDINMGTIEQYYDFCINKFPDHSAQEYGKIDYSIKLGEEQEKYVYSQACIEDINEYFEKMCKDIGVSLEKAYSIFEQKGNKQRIENTYAQKINNRLLKIQGVLNTNNEVMLKYFKGIRDAIDALYNLSATLRYRKERTLREIAKMISKYEEEVLKAQKELEKLNSEENAIATQNQNNIIKAAQKKIEKLKAERKNVEADEEYFASLLELNVKLESVVEPFKLIKTEFSQNKKRDVYDAINRTGQLIGGFFMLLWEFSKIEDKYLMYLGAIKKEVEKAGRCITILQGITEKYLDFEYYSQIEEEKEALTGISSNAIKNAYEFVMGKIGIRRNKSGKFKAVKCSPYIYLQVIYLYQGNQSISGNALLAIDEVQGIAPEEIRLLKNINGSGVVFNMFGDINQHIEGTKGIDSWDEIKDFLDFDLYEMKENYRNASQITDYCNHIFQMKMVAINTPGKGVHEMKSDAEFRSEMITQLMDTQRVGLAAILVSNDDEARYLLDTFSEYEKKFHDMTNEDFSIHRTRWNIINIDDAKGLEFSSVIVLSGRMSRNKKYIAFTRALDDLYVYSEIIDTTGYEKRTNQKNDKNTENDRTNRTINGRNNQADKVDNKPQTKHAVNSTSKSHKNSKVRTFFENNGLEVIDNRDEGGRLWAIGEKAEIRDIVNEAIAKFSISGKYASSKESKNKTGWCTKTDK